MTVNTMDFFGFLNKSLILKWLNYLLKKKNHIEITAPFYTSVLIFIIKPKNHKWLLNSLYSSQLFSYPSVSLGNSPHANLDLLLKH